MIELTDEQIKNTYKIISDYYEKYLKDKGVKLPKLKDKDGDYVKDALILVYLAQDYPNTHSITKGEFNNHKTVKPLTLCEYIINLTTFDELSTVLDPFVGSGTTVVAAKKLGRKYIGIDINIEYIKIALERLSHTEVEDNIKKSKSNNKSGVVQYSLFGVENNFIGENQYKKRIPKST